MDWISVMENSAPFLNDEKREILLGLSGDHSINPMVLLTIVILDDELGLASVAQGEKEFFDGLKRLSTSLVKFSNQFEKSSHTPKINSAMSSVWLTLRSKDETLYHFLEMYHMLLSKNKITTTVARKDSSSFSGEVNLKSSMTWPWAHSECWEIGPTHNGAAASDDDYDIPAALDCGPSLYNQWSQNFDYLGSTGAVHAAHSGKVTVHSSCSLQVVAGRFSTYYGHVLVKPNINNTHVKQGDHIGDIQIQPDKAQCNCDWQSRSYECSTGLFYKSIINLTINDIYKKSY